MHYGLTQSPSLSHNECLVLGLFANESLPDVASEWNKKHHDLINKLAKKTNEAGDMAWQMDVEDHSLLLIHCGKKEDWTTQALQKRINEVTDALIKQRVRSATLCLPLIHEKNSAQQLEQMITQIDTLCYQLLDFKKKNIKKYALNAIDFYLPGANNEALNAAQAIIAGVTLTRQLADMPANICTPTYLGEQAQKLAEEQANVHCTVMGQEELHAMGMGTFLAVSQGSAQEPKLIDVQYHGHPDAPPVILVGKGITFDSGGLSIKPANAMDEMKYDMAGAASVLGTIKACALLKLPINVIGIIASAENLIGSSAVKPGDIVTSMSGQTVEIINTDAEGRLVLADALTYAERYNPHFVIDIATLTGAIVVALGAISSGYMTKDEELATLLEHAAQESQDKIWRMPLDDAYQEALDSPLADMVNATFDRSAGSITAACFLSRFTEHYRWAHLDIAGTAWVSGKKRTATGRPVPLLTQMLRHVARSR